MATVDYFERKLDDKRRLTIPRNFVTSLQRSSNNRGFGEYLHLYPKDVWNNLVEPRLTGDILDERIADLNVSLEWARSSNRPTANRDELPSSSIAGLRGIDRDVVAVVSDVTGV